MESMKAFIAFCKEHSAMGALAIILIVGGFVLAQRYDQFEDLGETDFHGPHFSSQQVAAVSRADFSWARRQRRSQSVPAPITATTTTVTTTSATTGPTPVVVATSTPTPISTPTAPVITILTGFGIAAGGGLTGFSQSDLDTYFTSLKALGVTWVRWDIDWSVIQPNNATTYDWQGTDRVAATAAKYGINSLGIITIAPQWALDPKRSCTIDQHCPPLDPATYATFSAAAAARYKGIINTWEIWNEPNLNGGWKTAAGGAGYPAYLKAAYTAIKQVNSNAFVISGGLAAAADEGNNTSPLTWMRSLYTAGMKDYFDAVALHPYSYPVAASYVASWNSWQQMTAVRQLMVDNGDSAKKIWVTEYGAPTGGPGSMKNLNQLSFTYGADYMSEAAQQQMLQDVMTLYGQDKGWMGPFFWYSLKDNGSTNVTPENFFGVLRYDGTQKPAYQSFKSLITTGV